jgi:hypothetical protein
MNYAVEMGTDAMTYTPSFIKTDSGVQNLLQGVIHRQTAW